MSILTPSEAVQNKFNQGQVDNVVRSKDGEIRRTNLRFLKYGEKVSKVEVCGVD